MYKQMQPTRPALLWVALSLLLVGARAGCAIAPDANGHGVPGATATLIGLYQCTSLVSITAGGLTTIGADAFSTASLVNAAAGRRP